MIGGSFCSYSSTSLVSVIRKKKSFKKLVHLLGPAASGSVSLVGESIRARSGTSAGRMAEEPGTFLYFAFGSNLWTNRIHENNPSAKMVSVAKLKDHKLEFAYWAKRWRGGAANIIPETGSHVFGVLWRLDDCHQESLDRQEGVGENVYQRINLAVETHPEGEKVNCVAYQIREDTRLKAREEHGDKLIPSLRYKNVIIQGAKEHGIPEEYIQMLTDIPDNGYNGDVDVDIPKLN